MTDKNITICGHGSGKPSLKNLNTYSTTRYKSTFSYKGKEYRKLIIRVRRLKAMVPSSWIKFHDTYKTILNRNNYSQDYRGYVYSPRDNGKYYSDCSSSGCATYKKIGHSVSLLNTVGILTSDLFEDVPVKIEKGHITNPEVLQIGDAILFAGNSSRPDNEFCGHVEYVYEINGEVPTKEDGKAPAVPTVPTETPSTPSAGKVGYTGTFPALPARRYYKFGDGYKTLVNYKTQIKRIQMLVNWACGLNLEVDGKYGNDTKAGVIKLQRLVGSEDDGEFGSDTLAKAKKFKK